MRRGDIYWADLGPPAGTRPVVVVTRSAATAVRTKVTVALVSTTIRGIASEVSVGESEGLPRPSVAQCDELTTIPKGWFIGKKVGNLSLPKLGELDTAICFALGIDRR